MRKINGKILLLVLAVTIVLTPFSAVLASERAGIFKEASDNLKNKVKEVQAVIKDFAGSSFDDQCKAALDNLKKNPNSLKLQLDMCNILTAYTDKLYNSFTKAEQADLGTLRDRVVQGFKTISELKAAEAQKYQNRANSAQGKWKIRYEQLSTTCLNFSKAYELRAQNYQKIPMDEQILEVKASIEYLDCVKEVLVGLKEFIKTVQADVETLQQLQDTQKALVNLQKSILTFSEVVLDGAFRAGEDLPNTSNKQTQESKS